MRSGQGCGQRLQQQLGRRPTNTTTTGMRPQIASPSRGGVLLGWTDAYSGLLWFRGRAQGRVEGLSNNLQIHSMREIGWPERALHEKAAMASMMRAAKPISASRASRSRTVRCEAGEARQVVAPPSQPGDAHPASGHSMPLSSSGIGVLRVARSSPAAQSG